MNALSLGPIPLNPSFQEVQWDLESPTIFLMYKKGIVLPLLFLEPGNPKMLHAEITYSEVLEN